MSDPIDKLSRLGDALEGAPMPLPASEIRARGDRIRRRRHAVAAGASAAVVAAVAVPVIAIAAGGSDKDDRPFTPDPTFTDSVPAAALSTDNLLTTEDAIYPNDGGDWEESATFPEGNGQVTPDLCQQSAFADLGADTVLVRNFEFVHDVVGVDPSNLFSEVVAEFPDDTTAASAYATVQGWYADCRPEGSTGFTPNEIVAVPIEVDGTAERRLLISRSARDDGTFLDTGIVLSGDRVAVLAQETPGPDSNWPEGGSPVELMLPVAAERLVLGSGVIVPTDDPTSSTDWPTTIPSGFPLASGWPEDDGSSETQYDPPSRDNEGMIAAGDLRACGNSAGDPGPVDRLTTRFSDPVDFYIRELQLFPTDQEAVTYLAHLRALYGDCPTEGSTPTFTTQVNDGALDDESIVITSVGEEIYRTVINVVRIGNAVVVDLKSDEGLAADIDSLAVETRENLGDVIGRMNELQGGGATSTPGLADPTDPAGSTTIASDFPLALYPAEPPTADSETTITGPERDLNAVGDLPICGVAPLPTKPADRLGYTVTGIEYGDLRELRTYRTAQVAVDELQSLRDRLGDCDREPTEQDGWSKVWRVFDGNDADTGYDSVTFGYTTEMDDSDSFAPSGQLMTAVRVGNSILIMVWYAEYGAESMADNVPSLLDTVDLITPAMCAFTADGC